VIILKTTQMKRIIGIMILSLAFEAVSAQDAKDLLVLKASEHPRILLLKGEEDSIRKTIASDGIWKKIDSFISSESDRIIDKPPVERVLIGRRLLDKSREALRRIFYLSYAYRMTGEKEYYDRAVKEMLAVSSFSDWNPSHFLDVAEMTMAVAIGYDWLYNELPGETRSVLRQAIIEKGLNPSLQPEIPWWSKEYHNWNQVCNAGMTYGALAVFEDEQELATKIIRRAITTISLPMGDYEPGGAYPEGYSYWGYGTSFNIMFLSAMENAFGEEFGLKIKPGFFKTASYLENMTGPTGNSFNYSDAGQGGGLNPAMFWFAGRLKDPSLLWSERYHLENGNLPNDRLLPAMMVWGAGITMDKIIPPSKLQWVGQGKNPVALMRTSWTDRDAIYVGLKAGSPMMNHGHMDAGSFIMEAGGERWAMDFGMQDYNSLETAGVDLWNMSQNSQRWQVYRYNNFVHNTLTVNDSLQVVRGYSVISSCSDSTGMMNAITDISWIYRNVLKKAVRGIAIVDNKYVMVRDEIETSDKQARVRWNMLTSAGVSLVGKDAAELVKNGKKLIVRIKSPAGAEIKTAETLPPHSYDAPNPGTTLVRLEIEIPAYSAEELVVLLLPEGVQENQNATGMKLSQWPGIK
jgi:hypothetical protein